VAPYLKMVFMVYTNYVPSFMLYQKVHKKVLRSSTKRKEATDKKKYHGAVDESSSE